MINRCYVFLFVLPFLFACQSSQQFQAKQSTSPTSLYLDSDFYTNSIEHIETEQEIFQLDDEMRAMVKAKLVNTLTTKEKSHVLLEHLFNEEHISLSYEGNANLTAIQAYHSKVANCMSLTILAYALADEAGMNISFQQVNVPEYWVRNGQYSLVTGHVNLLVQESTIVNKRTIWGQNASRIDFDPFIAKKRFPSRTIKKPTLLAMFYNNKGAEALVKNNYSLSYQYLKKATQSDSQFSSAWGNLGILYKLTGHYEKAEKAYRHAISLDNRNLTSLGNLALLLNNNGRVDEAEPIEKYLHKQRVKNPYYHALLGNEAFFNQSYKQALHHYKKAIQLNNEQHEFYFGLAKVYYMQNEFSLAERAMKRAVALTKAKDTQSQYIAKLNFLRHQETRQH